MTFFIMSRQFVFYMPFLVIFYYHVMLPVSSMVLCLGAYKFAFIHVNYRHADKRILLVCAMSKSCKHIQFENGSEKRLPLWLYWAWNA